MGLRINSNVLQQSLSRHLDHAQDGVNKELERLSSGNRILSASEDSAGLAMSTQMKAQVRGLQQATRNANDGISFVQTAEGGLGEVSNILVRLRELTIQSSSDTVGEGERGLLDKEYTQLITEIDRISEATTFNGTNAINGHDKGYLHFQVGSFKSDENVIEFNSDTARVSTSDMGVLNTNITNKMDALDAIENIDEAIDAVSSQRAELGAVQSRLQHAVNNLEVQTIAHQRAKSQIADNDVAMSSAKLASFQLQKEGAISSLAKSLQFAESAKKLIS